MSQNWKDPHWIQGWEQNPDQANPSRAEQLDILITLLADAYQDGQWMLDLGFGSGRVEALIFQRLPEAHIVGVDSSSAMMALAHARLADYADQFETVEHDLAQIDHLTLPDHPYYYAISIQTLHHLQPEAMQAVYRYIYQTLEPNGLFLLLDRIKVSTPHLFAAYRTLWQRQDQLAGTHASDQEGDTFEQHTERVWSGGDLPETLEHHLQWFREAGFEGACLHLHGNRALIAGRKTS